MAIRNGARTRAPGALPMTAVLGLFFLWLGGHALFADHQMSAHGVTTTATVVAVHPGRDFSYTVRFQLPGGASVTADTGATSTDPVLVEGDGIQVEYLPDHPATVDQIGARGGQWVVWTLFLALGLALLGLAAALSASVQRLRARRVAGPATPRG